MTTTTLPNWTRIRNEDNGMLNYRANVSPGLWVEIRHYWERRARRDGKIAYWLFTDKYYDTDVEETSWDVVLVDGTDDYEYIDVGFRTLGDAKIAVGAFLGYEPAK